MSENEQGQAFLVGINEYTHESLSSFSGSNSPVEDVRDFKDILKETKVSFYKPQVVLEDNPINYDRYTFGKAQRIFIRKKL